MAIKDLQRTTPGLSRAGIIRLGYKIKNCKKCRKPNRESVKVCEECGGTEFGNIYPTQAKHFILDNAPGVAEATGTPAPTELKIYFPFDEIDKVFPAYHQYWVASALVCRGDGEKILYAINPQTGKVVVRDGVAIENFETKTPDGTTIAVNEGKPALCPGVKHNLYGRCKLCKPNAMLIVLLRDVPRLAYWQISTASIHNIVNLTEQMTYIKLAMGKLRGVPFILKLEPRKISVPKSDNTGRQRVEKYLLSLEVDEDWMKRLMLAQGILADPSRLISSRTTDDEETWAMPRFIDVEPEPTAPVSPISEVEPPLWLPPNGHDDSSSEADIVSALAELELIYDPENEQFIFDELAKFATRKADTKVSK